MESEALRTEVESAREQEAGWGGKVSQMETDLATMRLNALEQEKLVEAIQENHQRSQGQTQNLGIPDP